MPQKQDLPIVTKIEHLREIARDYNIRITEMEVVDKDYKSLAGKLTKFPIKLRMIFNDIVYTCIVKRTPKNK